MASFHRQEKKNKFWSLQGVPTFSGSIWIRKGITESFLTHDKLLKLRENNGFLTNLPFEC